jgi:hypothetical protein
MGVVRLRGAAHGTHTDILLAAAGNEDDDGCWSPAGMRRRRRRQLRTTFVVNIDRRLDSSGLWRWR